MIKIDSNTWVELSKSSLLHNVRQTRRRIGNSVNLFAVVKANAYGHGQKEVVSIIKNYVDGFCVASTKEALYVKTLVPAKRVIVLSYFTTLKKAHILNLAKRGIEVPIYSIQELEKVARLSIPLKVHIKIDSGASRIGFKKEQIRKLILALKKYKHLQVVGIYSHFADVEDYTSLFSKIQLEDFSKFSENIIKELSLPKNVLRHIACSAAISRDKKTHFDGVRLGIHLYGLTGIKPGLAKLGLKPVMSWKTRVLQVKDLKAHETVGYNRTYRAPRKTKIAVLPVGYWDGYDRLSSNNGYVIIRGKTAPIRGNICMNLCMVDISKIRGVKEGDEVFLLSPKHHSITATQIAKRTSTINYEVVTRIRETIPRIIKK